MALTHVCCMLLILLVGYNLMETTGVLKYDTQDGSGLSKAGIKRRESPLRFGVHGSSPKAHPLRADSIPDDNGCQWLYVLRDTLAEVNHGFDSFTTAASEEVRMVYNEFLTTFDVEWASIDGGKMADMFTGMGNVSVDLLEMIGSKYNFFKSEARRIYDDFLGALQLDWSVFDGSKDAKQGKLRKPGKSQKHGKQNVAVRNRVKGRYDDYIEHVEKMEKLEKMFMEEYKEVVTWLWILACFGYVHLVVMIILMIAEKYNKAVAGLYEMFNKALAGLYKMIPKCLVKRVKRMVKRQCGGNKRNECKLDQKSRNWIRKRVRKNKM